MPHEATTDWTKGTPDDATALIAVEWGLAAGALPAIAVGIDAPIGLAHWVLVAHYLAIAYGCHLLRTGRLLLDVRMLRRNGFLLLGFGSLACAAAPGAYTLVAARLPQALGLACLLAARSPGAVVNRLPVLSTVAGLLAGSLIANCIGWRAVFGVTAAVGLLAAFRQHPQMSLPPPQRVPPHPGRHPIILAGGLAGIIVPVNHYCDFRAFGLEEAVVLLVGIVLFVLYAHEAVRELIASRSPLLSLWLGAIVAGLSLLPALFHVHHLPAPNPAFTAIQTGCVLAFAFIACALTLWLLRCSSSFINRFLPTAGFLLLTGVCWLVSSRVVMESLPCFAVVAASAGGALGLAWTGCALRPVPLFAGLGVGVYAASYFLEFIPASFGGVSAPAGREFLRQESNVFLTAMCVACVGVGWAVVRACRKSAV